MTELWQTGGFDRGPDEQAAAAFTYGLRLLLDGIGRQSSETTGLRSSPMP
jgi:hypothetical protein